MVASIRTSAVTYVETEHARERRKQRGIEWKDPQAAKTYGKPQVSKWPGVIKYEYKEIYYFFKQRGGELVTCYAKPLPLKKVEVTQPMLDDHGKACAAIQADLPSWTSNTVMVVDASGSMRESDMWGTRNR